jgi:hypothetical protein
MIGRMAKAKRPTLPKAVKEKVLTEFNHRCAVCGKERPHIHHIDGQNSNNALHNLLPLCPNCHLIDQHNPTVPINPLRLSIFRTHKNPLILSPQFGPIFKRMRFLFSVIAQTGVTFDEARFAADQLVLFIAELEMGNYYARAVGDHILYRDDHHEVSGMFSNYTPAELESDYMERLRQNAGGAIDLIVECLRYQKWEWSPHRKEL